MRLIKIEKLFYLDKRTSLLWNRSQKSDDEVHIKRPNKLEYLSQATL